MRTKRELPERKGKPRSSRRSAANSQVSAAGEAAVVVVFVAQAIRGRTAGSRAAHDISTEDYLSEVSVKVAVRQEEAEQRSALCAGGQGICTVNVLSAGLEVVQELLRAGEDSPLSDELSGYILFNRVYERAYYPEDTSDVPDLTTDHIISHALLNYSDFSSRTPVNHLVNVGHEYSYQPVAVQRVLVQGNLAMPFGVTRCTLLQLFWI